MASRRAPRNRRIRQSVAASEALGALARSMGKSEFALGLAWATAAGARLQQNVRPIRLESGRLVVRAAGPQWAREVRRNEAALVTRLGEVLGKGKICALIVQTAAVPTDDA